jgi:glycerate-2-kinase
VPSIRVCSSSVCSSKKDVVQAFRPAFTGGSKGPHYVCLAVGKAARGMAEAAARRLGTRIRDGLVVTNVAGDGPFPVLVGSHPVPTDASEAAGAPPCASRNLPRRRPVPRSPVWRRVSTHGGPG